MNGPIPDRLPFERFMDRNRLNKCGRTAQLGFNGLFQLFGGRRKHNFLIRLEISGEVLFHTVMQMWPRWDWKLRLAVHVRHATSAKIVTEIPRRETSSSPIRFLSPRNSRQAVRLRKVSQDWKLPRPSLWHCGHYILGNRVAALHEKPSTFEMQCDQRHGRNRAGHAHWQRLLRAVRADQRQDNRKAEI